MVISVASGSGSSSVRLCSLFSQGTGEERGFCSVPSLAAWGAEAAVAVVAGAAVAAVAADSVGLAGGRAVAGAQAEAGKSSCVIVGDSHGSKADRTGKQAERSGGQEPGIRDPLRVRGPRRIPPRRLGSKCSVHARAQNIKIRAAGAEFAAGRGPVEDH